MMAQSRWKFVDNHLIDKFFGENVNQYNDYENGRAL